MRNRKGFTLVEMMIAIVILAIAVAGITTAFQSQVTSFSTQEAVTTAQTTGALVIMKLAEDIRMAGYGIPKDSTDGTTEAIRAVVNNDNTAGNSDSVTIRYCLGPSGYFMGTLSVANPSLTINIPGGSAFDTNTPVKVLNLRREDLFPGNAITASGAADNNVLLSGIASTAVPFDLGVFVGANTSNIRYFIAGAGTDNVALMREITPVGGAAQAPEVVAFGVEDVQFAYGLDPNGGGVNSYVNAPTAAERRQVLAVRINVILRSDKKDEGTIFGTVRAEDGPTRGGDGKRRRIFSTTVRLRNARVI